MTSDGVVKKKTPPAYTTLPLGHAFPALVRHVLGTIVFSLVTGLPSTASAASIATGLVRRPRQYYADVRLLAHVRARIVLLASRADPAAS